MKVLELKNVIMVKPHRGGVALWRMLSVVIDPKKSPFKVVICRLSKDSSIYFMPRDVLEEFDFHRYPWHWFKVVAEISEAKVACEEAREIEVSIEEVEWNRIIHIDDGHTIKTIYPNKEIKRKLEK